MLAVLTHQGHMGACLDICHLNLIFWLSSFSWFFAIAIPVLLAAVTKICNSIPSTRYPKTATLFWHPCMAQARFMDLGHPHVLEAVSVRRAEDLDSLMQPSEFTHEG